MTSQHIAEEVDVESATTADETPGGSPHTFPDLPFAAQTATGINYWSVAPTTNYGEDCATGRAHAGALLDYIARNGTPMLLHHVVKDVALSTAARPFSGIEVGFFHVIAVAATAHRRH